MTARKKQQIEDPFANANLDAVGLPKLGPRGSLGRDIVGEQMDQLREENEKLRETVEQLSTFLEGEKAKVAEVSNDLAKLMVEHDKTLEKVKALEENIKALSTEKEVLEENIKVLSTEKEALTTEKDSIAKERDEAVETSAMLQEDVEKLGQEVADLSQQLEEATRALEEAKAQSPLSEETIEAAVEKAMTEYQQWLDNVPVGSGFRYSVDIPLAYKMDYMRFKTFALEQGSSLLDKGQHIAAVAAYCAFVSLFLEHSPETVRNWLSPEDDSGNKHWRNSIVHEVYKLYHVYSAAIAAATDEDE